MKSIRSVTAFTNHVTNDEPQFYKSSYKEFNVAGDLICENRYNEEGSVIARTANIYDADGKLVETQYYDSLQETTETHSYTYNERGELLKETVDFGQGFLTVYAYHRDSSKRQLTISEQDEDGVVEETKTRVFDTNGNLLEETVYDDNNKAISRIKNSFDQNQRLIRKEENDLRYKTIQYHEYYYHESGRLTGVKTLNHKDKVQNWVKVEYDENNRPVKQITMNGHTITIEYPDELHRIEKHSDAGGMVYSRTEVELNNEGNVVSEHSPDEIVRFEYEYFGD